MTKQKILILSIIKSSNRHLSAEEIYNIAKEKMPSIALGTVYRNLGRLCEDNEIKLITKKGFPDCYDRSVYPHGHLICDSCGHVSDFPIADIGDELEDKLGEKLTGYDINAHYVCKTCKEKQVNAQQ